MPPRYRPYETPTFKQTVVIIQTMPPQDREDLEAIKLRHVKLGFHYQNDQIHRALKAVSETAARRWDHRKRRSARST